MSRENHDVSQEWVEVFDAAGHGRDWPRSAAEVAAIAAGYDPAFHEAPVKFDHEDRGPAGAWVQGLRADGTRLLARFGQMADWMRAALRSGAFKKRSVELYRDLSGRGPYLRAVALLGAAAPAVKGLRDPAFAEDEPTFERVTLEGAPVAALANREAETSPNEAKIAAGGAEQDRIDRTDDHRSDASDTSDPSAESTARQGSMHKGSSPPVNDQNNNAAPGPDADARFDDLIAELRVENAALKRELDTLQATRDRSEFECFLEEQRAAGKPVGVWVERGVTELYLGLRDGAVAFGEGESHPARETLRAILEATPSAVTFGESAPATSDDVSYSDSPPFGVDLESYNLARRAERLMANDPDLSFAEALARVS